MNDPMIPDSKHTADSSVQTQESVREYYGRVLNTSADLKTSACCLTESVLEHHREILAQIHPEVLEKFYGCGSAIPHELEGRVVLDPGYGSGWDAHLLSRLVGPRGRVIGVDMTPEQIAAVRRYVDYHRVRRGYAEPNVEFRQGHMEDLLSLDIQDSSIDLVVSNCVVNLSPDKQRVFSEIFRVLKPGGELYFSDIFSGLAFQRRSPPTRSCSESAWVEPCTEDFRRLVRKMGILDCRVVSRSRLDLRSPEVEAKAGMIDFYSTTIRAFKLPLEDICEDYGQVAFYLGTIPEAPHAFPLDDHHAFQAGMPMLVCGNTASMLQDTRFSRHFRVIGDRSVHHGPFACAQRPSAADPPAGGACC